MVGETLEGIWGPRLAETPSEPVLKQLTMIRVARLELTGALVALPVKHSEDPTDDPTTKMPLALLDRIPCLAVAQLILFSVECSCQHCLSEVVGKALFLCPVLIVRLGVVLHLLLIIAHHFLATVCADAGTAVSQPA